MTPLLKRHKDLDEELNARFKELEKKLFAPPFLTRLTNLTVFLSTANMVTRA